MELGAYRQTVLDIDWTKPGVYRATTKGASYIVRWDPMGRLLIKRREDSPKLPKEGEVLYVGDDRVKVKISSVDKLYEGRSVAAALCEVLS